MSGEKFIFPIEDGTVTTLWRRSGPENIPLNPGSPRPRRRTRKSSRRIRRVFFNPTSRLIAVWRWSQRRFLVLFMRFYLLSSRGTQSQTVRAERSIISYSTEIYRRYQDHRHNFGCDVGEKFWRLLERWWRSWIVRYMDRFHKIHNIEWKTTGWMYMVPGRLTRKQTTSRPDKLWPDMWKDMSDASKRKEKQKWTIENQSSIMPGDYVVSTSLILQTRNLRIS